MQDPKRATTERRILVLGASGMLGNAMYRVFGDSPGFRTIGTVRGSPAGAGLPATRNGTVVGGVDAEQPDSLASALAEHRPDVVINCVGLVKQLAKAEAPLSALPINALLPHRLSTLCSLLGARLVHFSTDCVFSGTRGAYLESDAPDARDLYGRSKLLGEVDAPHAVTLRTSIIGHELRGAHSLIGWFLAQGGPVSGYTRAVFSGLPTVTMARLVRDHVLPHPNLHGLYHVSAAPIDKDALLRLVAAAYDKQIEILPDAKVAIDRSLDSTRFRKATGFAPAPWPDLVAEMREFG